MSPVTFPVIGMKCSGCAERIAKALTELPGVNAAEVSLKEGLVTVSCDVNQVLLAQLRAKINSLGYGIDDLKMYPGKVGQCKLPQVEG